MKSNFVEKIIVKIVPHGGSACKVLLIENNAYNENTEEKKELKPLTKVITLLGPRLYIYDSGL